MPGQAGASKSPGSASTGRLKSLRGFLLRLPVYYAILITLGYLFQNYLIYPARKVDLQTVQKSAATLGMDLWPDRELDYRGFLSQNQAAGKAGTILVFHGNGGTALDRRFYVPALEPLGYRVLLAEYPGYGARPGNPGERAFIEDAVQMARLAAQTFGRPLYLFGESLGCGVVAGAVGTYASGIDGIALITPWNTLPDVAQAIYWFLPARWIVQDRYDSAANLAGYRGPVGITMAGRDAVIPNRLTLKLFEALETRKRLWTFPEAGHNSWPATPSAPWWNEMMAFLSSG